MQLGIGMSCAGQQLHLQDFFQQGLMGIPHDKGGTCGKHKQHPSSVQHWPVVSDFEGWAAKMASMDSTSVFKPHTVWQQPHLLSHLSTANEAGINHFVCPVLTEVLEAVRRLPEFRRQLHKDASDTLTACNGNPSTLWRFCQTYWLPQAAM